MRKTLLEVIILLLITSTAFCQDQPLQLTIKSDKQAYEVGEKIKIEITITNHSDKEMVAFWGSKEPEVYSEEIGVYNIAMYVLSQDEPMHIKSKENTTKAIFVTFDKRFEPLYGKVGLVFLYSNIAMPIDFMTKPNQEIFTGTLTSNAITVDVVEKKAITKEAIIAIAKKIPHNLGGLEAICDEGNQKWNKEWNKRRSYFGNLPEIYLPLVGKNYQAVYFAPKETKGLRAAGIWVFVDRDTGMVIEFQEEAN